jgi:phage N-6-adenine-methyltransferase
MSRTMPQQKPGSSRQDYGTPADFLRAVKLRFRVEEFVIDLAARSDNAKADSYITPEQNSLSLNWNEFSGWDCWLNPPFDDLGKWAKKCSTWNVGPNIGGGRLFFLTPASVGSNWFADYVYPNAMVYALNGRLIFEGETSPYPKDCILSIFGFSLVGTFDVWDWKETLRNPPAILR